MSLTGARGLQRCISPLCSVLAALICIGDVMLEQKQRQLFHRLFRAAENIVTSTIELLIGKTVLQSCTKYTVLKFTNHKNDIKSDTKKKKYILRFSIQFLTIY